MYTGLELVGEGGKGLVGEGLKTWFHGWDVNGVRELASWNTILLLHIDSAISCI